MHKAARQASLYWIDNHKPKSGPLFDIMKESKKSLNMHYCQKSQQKCKADAMTEVLWNRSPKKFWQNIRKSRKSWLPSIVGGKKGNKAATVMWRKHFSALLNSSKNCENGNFVHQNIISYGNFEGIDELMCNSFKIKTLLHKLPLNRAPGKKMASLLNTFSMLIQVCATTVWVVYSISMCVQCMEKFLRNACKHSLYIFAKKE